MDDEFMFIPYKAEGDPYPVIAWEDVPHLDVSNFPEFDMRFGRSWSTSEEGAKYMTYACCIENSQNGNKAVIKNTLLRWAYEHLRRVSLKHKIVVRQLPTVDRHYGDSVKDYSVYLAMRYGLGEGISIDE